MIWLQITLGTVLAFFFIDWNVCEGRWTTRLLQKLKLIKKPPVLSWREYLVHREEFRRRYGTWSLYACEDVVREADRRGINRWQVYGERASAHYEQLWWNSFLTVWLAIGQLYMWGPVPMLTKQPRHGTDNDVV